MLQLTPHALELLRATQSASLGKRQKAQANKPKPTVRQINKDRRKHLVDRAAEIMRSARQAGFVPTLLGLEGPIRHGLRSRLCLAGWTWCEADAAAVAIVEEALKRIGAQRPSPAEGQPDYAQNGAGAMIERTRCVRCHDPLPEGHTKFCSQLCNCAHHLRTTRRMEATDGRAYDLAVRL